MSFQDKYEKVILGVGITLAVIAGAWVYYDNSSFGEQFASASNIPNKNTNIPGTQKAEKLLTILDEDTHEISIPDVGKQKFNIFHSPVLYNKIGSTSVFDIYNSDPVHKDIPNSWFAENNLLDAFQMSDATEVDSDGDGFSNYEEYLAKTKPNDSVSFPDLADKLSGVEIKASGFELTYSVEAYTEKDPVEVRADFINASPGTRAIWRATVKPGEEFGEKESANRFKLVKIDKKEKNGMEASVIIVEDLQPEKRGETYEIFSGRRHAQRIIDLSAILSINGGPKKGESFTAIEGRTFIIPGDPTNTVYSAEKIDPKNKTLIFKKKDGGEERTISF